MAQNNRGVDRKAMSRRHFLSRGFGGLLVGQLLSSNGLRAEDVMLRRRLRFALTFSNSLEATLAGQGFWWYLPANIAPQRLIDLNVSMAHRLHRDMLGHNILELSFEHFPALAQKVVTVTTELDISTMRQRGGLSDRAVWLKAERFIEVGDSRIRELAAVLRRPNEMDTAWAIYDWVRGNLTYAGYLAEDLGALQALLTRRGDCTEYADLVVALARACGICARMLGGYVVDRDVVVRPQDYHNWAELYLDGRWALVDAQKENWLEAPDRQYVAVRIYRDEPGNGVGRAHRYRIDGELSVSL